MPQTFHYVKMFIIANSKASLYLYICYTEILLVQTNECDIDKNFII